MLQQLLLQAFVVADELGGKLCALGGVADEDAVDALTSAQDDERLKDPALFKQVFELDTQGSASVLEATAAAAGSIRDAGRRVVVVADIGAGTSDFGAFLTGLPGTDVLAEIRGSSHVLKEAGDHIDMLLASFILEKAGLDIQKPSGRRAERRLRQRRQSNKEALFGGGALLVDLDEDTVTVTVEEFLADLDVKAFAWRLRLTFHDVLLSAVACAKRYSVDTRLPVEILLTGGGHALPMVKALADRPSVEWVYASAAPEIPEGDVSDDFRIVRPGSPWRSVAPSGICRAPLFLGHAEESRGMEADRGRPCKRRAASVSSSAPAQTLKRKTPARPPLFKAPSRPLRPRPCDPGAFTDPDHMPLKCAAAAAAAGGSGKRCCRQGSLERAERTRASSRSYTGQGRLSAQSSDPIRCRKEDSWAATRNTGPGFSKGVTGSPPRSSAGARPEARRWSGHAADSRAAQRLNMGGGGPDEVPRCPQAQGRGQAPPAARCAQAARGTRGAAQRNESSGACGSLSEPGGAGRDRPCIAERQGGDPLERSGLPPR